MVRPLLIAIGCLTACAPAGGPRPEAPLPDPAARAVRLTPDTTRYVFASHRNLEQQVQGRSTTQAAASTYWFTVTLAPAGGDTLAVRFLIDSAAASDGPPIGGALSGAAYQGRALPSGVLLAFNGDSGTGARSHLVNKLRDFYPRLPAAGARLGMVWHDTLTDTTDVGGLLLTLRTESRHEAVGFDVVGGIEALAIVTRTTYTLAGEGSQSGQPLTLEGGGREVRRDYVTAGGRYLGGTAADTSRYTVQLTALGMSIPGRRWSADTLRVAP